MNGKPETANQTILRAAASLAADFTLSELVLASWMLDKKRFGLPEFSDLYPDSRRVSMEVMGRKPRSPVMLGFMIRVCPNVYMLTDRGRIEARRIGGEDSLAMPKPGTSPIDSAWLTSMEAAYADDAAARAALPKLWERIVARGLPHDGWVWENGEFRLMKERRK